MNSPAMASQIVPALAQGKHRAVWAPPPQWTVSQWADEERRLSRESSAEPGRWQTSRAEYQRGIMDAVADPTVREIWVMKSAQIGWTEILGNVVGYHMDQDPATMLLIQPTLEMAEAWSKDRLEPMLRDTPALHGKVKDGRGRGTTSTLLHKPYPGGALTIAGANSPASLASRPIRVVMCDEIDRYPVSAGTEGDPIKLAQKRSSNFWNRRFLAGSTPTVKGGSRIELGYLQSDRRRYFVPCPHCEAEQVLEWKRVIWPEGKPEEALYHCEACGAGLDDGDRHRMIARGVWRPTVSDARPGIVGFHIWEAYSPWRRLGEIASEFLAAQKHPELLRVFVNTSLGETWEDRAGDALDESSLTSRRATWDAHSLPDDVVCATAGVDVQDDRLEITLVGWCEQQRARIAAHHVLYGSPGAAEVWSALDALLLESLQTDAGRRVKVIGACVDSGGHHAARVMQFAAERQGRCVWATKGAAGARPVWPPKVTKSTTHRGARVWVIGVDTVKDWLRGSLAVRDDSLPHHVSFAATLEDEWFAQLLAEKRTVKYSASGAATRQWVKRPGDRNEALDCVVLAFAALEGLKSQRRLVLRMPARAQETGVEAPQGRRAGGMAAAPAKAPKPSNFASAEWLRRL